MQIKFGTEEANYKVSGLECGTVCCRDMDINTGRYRSKLVAFEVWIWRTMEKISWMDKKTNEEILNMVEEDRKTRYGVVNINGWVMCYSMMDCCMMYWKEGCPIVLSCRPIVGLSDNNCSS